MSNYVLVHGAWEGSWAWEDVTPSLEEQGHSVIAVDLPGSFGNPQSVADASLDSYMATVLRAIESFDSPAILVAHSLGGASISQVAERFPEKIERLVYVASFLLKDGGSILEAMQSDKDGQILPQLSISEDQTYATVSEAVWRQVAFHDASPELIGRALPRLATKQSLQPFTTALRLTQKRFGSVSKQFVRTSLDRMVTPWLQQEMLKNWPVDRLDTLDAGHFPTLSASPQLARLL